MLSQTPKDEKKLEVLKNFIGSNKFDEDRKGLTRLVKRNVYWDDPDTGDK